MTNDLLGAWLLSAVRSLEVVRISEEKCTQLMRRSAGGMWFVRCTEVVRFLECPLSEVPLYPQWNYITIPSFMFRCVTVSELRLFK